jgi:hypothetical protein
MAALGTALHAATPDDAVWAEIQATGEHKRKLSETEQKRLERLQASVSLVEANVLLSRLYDVVAHHVRDTAVLSAIGRELATLGALPTPTTASGGGNGMPALPPAPGDSGRGTPRLREETARGD